MYTHYRIKKKKKNSKDTISYLFTFWVLISEDTLQQAKTRGAGHVAHTCNHRTREAVRKRCKIKAHGCHTVSSRPARATYLVRPYLKRKRKQNQNYTWNPQYTEIF